MAKIEIPIAFYPRRAFEEPWQFVEINPVKKDGDTFTQCESDDPELYCWSVYLRSFSGEARCVANVPNQNLAFNLMQLIKYAAKSKK